MLYPCSGCDRHLRDSDRICPFCGALQELAASPTLGAVALAVMLLGSTACTRDPIPGSAAGTTTSMSSASGTTSPDSGTTDTSTTLDTGDTTDDSDTAPGSFYAGPTDIGAPLSCSPWEQDCPEDEKCVPYSSTSGNFDGNKCVPVLGDGEPGEPCSYGGTAEATDDCGASSYCWAWGDTGTCYEFCLDDTFCNVPGFDCMVDDAGVINLCAPSCDVILQDCEPGFGCYLATGEDPWRGFGCAPTTENIEIGAPCDAINDCAVGLTCRPASTMPDCAGDSCCASFCHLAMPETCSQPGTECNSIFGEGMSPGTEADDLGLCTLPQP